MSSVESSLRPSPPRCRLRQAQVEVEDPGVELGPKDTGRTLVVLDPEHVVVEDDSSEEAAILKNP